MELHQLRYFVAIAEAGNFTRAAERCFVTQPSLSQQILNLESELGHKLFHRLGRKAVLTDVGEAFIERARRVLAEVDGATKEIKDYANAEHRIVVGAIPTIMPYLIAPLIGQLRRRHPNLIVHTREDFRTPLIKAIVEGELDFALVATPVRDPRVLVEPLFSEPLLLAVSQKHKLATQETVSADDLVNETFVLLGYSSSLAVQIQSFCGANNFEPIIGYRCAQIMTVKSIVASGLGISILPQVAVSKTGDEGIVYRKLSGRAPDREIALVRHFQRYQSQGTGVFLQAMHERIKTYGGIDPIEPKSHRPRSKTQAMPKPSAQ